MMIDSPASDPDKTPDVLLKALPDERLSIMILDRSFQLSPVQNELHDHKVCRKTNILDESTVSCLSFFAFLADPRCHTTATSSRCTVSTRC